MHISKIGLLVFAMALPAQEIPRFDLLPGPLTFSGSSNPWRFVNAVGERSGVWGFENGRLEGWVYPLKIFHDFHLTFQLEGQPRVHTGDEIVRAVRVSPHMVQLHYAAESFTIVQTLFAPKHEPGFAILLDVIAPSTLRVLARFRPDLNLMWPGAVSGMTSQWDMAGKRIRLSEPTGRFSALVGSPAAVSSTAVGYRPYLTNESPYEILEMKITPEIAAKSYVPIVVAGGAGDRSGVDAAYAKLQGNFRRLYEQSVQHYADLEAGGTEFITPDPAVNEALRWARVSLDQLRVCNPHLGCSSVSGYGPSGTGNRPMYAWFFDEPTATSWAFLEYGGAARVKEAFRFLQKYQRADGQIPHEVSQSAHFIDWFKDYPYAYIHPDSPLWYLIAMGHFYRFTGDAAFVKESWPSVAAAYKYCVSLLDPADGLVRIPAGQWGSIEAPGFSKDAAMAGEWIAALRAVRDIAVLAGEKRIAGECESRERLATRSLERFWNPQADYYDYGTDAAGKRVTHLNPMIGYSAWLGSLPDNRAEAVLKRLRTAMFLSDWGQRSLSLEDPRASEVSYQTGSVWPFLTAGPLLGQYRYHHAAQAFATWRALVALRTFHARGAMPESLSGRTYRLLDHAVPHQMFSEIGVIPGLVDGILCLEPDVPRQWVRLAPHLPPGWPRVALSRFPFGDRRLNLELEQGAGSLRARLELNAGPEVTLGFSPALPAGSRVMSVVMDGRPIAYRVEQQASDVHVSVKTKLTRKTRLEIRYDGGVSVEIEPEALVEGDVSRGLRVLEESIVGGRLRLVVEGRPERLYHLRLHTPWKVTPAGGATVESSVGYWRAALAAPAKEGVDRAGYVRWSVEFRLEPNSKAATVRGACPSGALPSQYPGWTQARRP